jgi:signal transduction histidine kinase
MALMLGILRERENRWRLRTLKAENLAAIGQTVSGIAHDMKTFLVAIAGFSRQILKKLGGVDPHRKKLTIIHQEAQRLENMVKDMLEYARPLDLRLSREDVNQIILESVAIVRDMAEAKQVTIESRLSPDICPVDLDAMRMKQVFINLLTNATQASPSGETVGVGSVNEAGRIIIDITDHGRGLTAEEKENIFTPFFTTKKEGIGLGLVMVKNIVSAHGGQVQFFDNPPPQAGVTFRVALPREVETKSSQMQQR